MINDVLEQLAEDYFRNKGYFTQHNVKYRPKRKGPAYAVHSDIDIVAVHPRKTGLDKVAVVSCKSWHGGLSIKRALRDIEKNFRRSRKIYREIALPVWSNAFKQKVKAITGREYFIFYIACTSYNRKDKDLWEKNKKFRKNLQGCEIKLLDMGTMIKDVWNAVNTITPENSELSRLLQMIHNSGGSLDYK